MFQLIAKKIFGSVNDRMIKSLLPEVEKINALESKISALSDDELKAKTAEFKKNLADGASLDSLLYEAFAVVREASKRALNMRHFDVQLVGGMVLHQGKISEMKTGEGKTLVATLPCYLNALSGKGVHVVTVNDYLARRDAEWMGKIHEFLGLTVGCLTNDLNDEERKAAYECDITYATNNELGFDYLRDNMKFSREHMVQRSHHFAIVDEVDSILIDEARTPLIISGPTNDNSKLYEEINRLIPRLAATDFQLEEKDRGVFLTEAGIETVEKILKNSGLIESNSSLYDPTHISLVHHVNCALKAHKIFKNEIDYIVKDGAVVIIDEFTGRMQEGRRFSDGLHQALEAKEGVKVRNENQTLASITFQNYFRLYKKLAGMTGTAQTEAVEFEEIYGLKVAEIPTNRPITRKDEDDEIYKNDQGKYEAIIKSIKEAHEKNQPILVGTVSIEKSEYLSKLLRAHKLPHQVLNAKYHEKEAEIIAQAGKPGAITIATNMAGRGTDIKLGGADENEKEKKIVIEAGGLYVLGTERHESRRIDNQLRGRSGRQGDPGKSKFFLSLEDDLMRIFGSEKLQSLLSTFGLKDDEAIFHPWITKTLAGAQHKVEMRNFEIRKNLLKYDDVVNHQRKNIFALRTEIMDSGDVSEKIKTFASQINQDLVEDCIPKNSYVEQWEIDLLQKEIFRIYGLKPDLKNEAQKEGATEKEILNLIQTSVEAVFEDKEKLYGAEIMHQVERQIFLITLDSEWKDHLLSLDKLRHGINLRAYAQKDPLIEYKRDALNLFEEMMMRIEEQVASRLAHVQVNIENAEDALNLVARAPKQKMFESRNDPAMANAHEIVSSSSPIKSNVKPEDRDPRDQSTWGNVGRNETCPCGSGKKFKQCHG
ncbi:MAG: preprotein translocase subunit SecA [Alphaproteobacteria bacterium RIFCSPLOWO2_01_FULL_40_26]|nr:MAG: preprotein translocase subunit SecA [Alphaproteobacteria bacterium RIFCSPHIGHO2_02_FULL_40_34]OFW94275.1 MAG: preprotein translocase subunit SecA [Alphaproteobacteria bacterium RIFCSPLOWO2_01_FULL_40_26]OFX09844.1 MAG: preprotein translocase subunit SecA [Alphaproteobacteria bacterium RIFCSPLOWO2_02_FULL_40_19]OFX11427.1 MAG: preprotein translocase subunit SecA [Alphaproteobacteria bacterium RIFCSPLOWO2_12_FULL_40_11]